MGIQYRDLEYNVNCYEEVYGDIELEYPTSSEIKQMFGIDVSRFNETGTPVTYQNQKVAYKVIGMSYEEGSRARILQFYFDFQSLDLEILQEFMVVYEYITSSTYTRRYVTKPDVYLKAIAYLMELGLTDYSDLDRWNEECFPKDICHYYPWNQFAIEDVDHLGIFESIGE